MSKEFWKMYLLVVFGIINENVTSPPVVLKKYVLSDVGLIMSVSELF